MMRRLCAGFAFGPVLIASSCAGPATDAAAGDAAAEVWTVAPEPSVSIGTRDGPAETLLFRVSSAFVLSDGTIALSNGGTFELRFYDAEGRFQRSVGGEGDAPGQFRSLSDVWRMRGDTLAAWDGRLRRLSFFTRDGDFAGSRSLVLPTLSLSSSMAAHNLNFRGVFADGSAVAVTGNALLERQLAAMGRTSVDDGRRNSEELVLVLARDGAVLSPAAVLAPVSFADADTLGVFAGDDEYIYRAASRPGGPVQPQFAPVTYGERFLWALGPDFFAVGRGKPYSVDLYDRTGALRATVGRRVPGIPVTDDLVRQHNDAVLANTVEQNRAMRIASFDVVPAADTLPAYDELSFDRTGNLWVREFAPSPEQPAVYSVFTPDGTRLAQLTVPTGLTILDRGPDYLLTRSRGEYDVEQIRLYRITRGSG